VVGAEESDFESFLWGSVEYRSVRRPREYVEARDSWLEEHLEMLEDVEPCHACLVVLRDDIGEDGSAIEFEEFAKSGAFCSGRRTDDGSFTFGTDEEVLAELSGRAKSASWVRAAKRALDSQRERALGLGGWRQTRVAVGTFSGVLAHASSRLNRRSIEEFGLDWKRMGAARGIAGSPDAELSGVFLDYPESISFFTRMPDEAPDVWLVEADGLWLELGPDGFWFAQDPIPPSRLRLAKPGEITDLSE
jgi:hypothetical protein